MLRDELTFGYQWDLYNEIIKWKEENQEIPVFIWGTGSTAIGVYKNLLRNGISIDGFFYDTESVIVDSRLKEYKKGIYSLKKLLTQYNKFSVIIGHSHYELAKKISDLDKVIKLWFLTGVICEDIGIDEEFVKENMEGYEYTFSKLSDDNSRENMILYLNAHLTKDGRGIYRKFKNPITFFENDIFVLGENEVYCDCGAYDGKSAKCFLNMVDYKYKKMYIIEVMRDMYETLKNMDCFEDEKIDILNVGLSDHIGEDFFQFDSQDTCLSSGEGSEAVAVTMLDEVIGDNCISLMKIAIENSIEKILLGGSKVIRRDLPKIVIMVGVDKRALVNYVPLLEKIAGEGNYRFFLRYTNASADCLCLFAVPCRED